VLLARPAPETQGIQALKGLLVLLVLLALPAALVVLVPPVRQAVLELPVLLVLLAAPAGLAWAAVMEDVTLMAAPDAPATPATATSPVPIRGILRTGPSRVEENRNDLR
jgi:hypothetical protein